MATIMGYCCEWLRTTNTRFAMNPLSSSFLCVGLTLSGGRPQAGPQQSERPSAGESRQARMSGLVFALGVVAFALGGWR